MNCAGVGIEPVTDTPPLRILVVDDDLAILRMIERVLESEGWAVAAASSAERALELIDHEFDVVVLDLQMPQMDGAALYALLRSRSYTMPVLVLSAFGAARAASEVGADAAMGKPFDIDEFVERVRSLAARSAGASA